MTCDLFKNFRIFKMFSENFRFSKALIFKNALSPNLNTTVLNGIKIKEVNPNHKDKKKMDRKRSDLEGGACHQCKGCTEHKN